MKKYINIIMGIVMVIVTTMLLGFIVYSINASKPAGILLIVVSFMGYGTSYIFFTNKN
jgi:hypothetical protein